jgi:hypothetical protein
MYQNQTITKKLLEGGHIAVHMYENNPRMIPPGIDPQCHRMFMTVSTTEEKQVKKIKQRNQDIRKLLVNPSGSKATGEQFTNQHLLFPFRHSIFLTIQCTFIP